MSSTSEGIYQQALELTALVDAVLEKAEARFHHKDTLDKASTLVAICVAQAASETTKVARRRQYRAARRAMTDCIVVLDILARRPGMGGEEVIAPAHALATHLVTELAKLEVR